MSSFLHLLALAQGDPQLESEARFGELFDVLHRRIWEPARRQGLAEAGNQLASVAAHLTLPLEAEREASESGEAAKRTLDRLAELQDRVRQFRSGATRWQQRLAEGMQEVIGEVDHDLRTRLRVVSRMAEGRADTDRPADDLVFEVWLHKTAMEAVIAHYEAIAERMSALADEVAQQFVAFDRDVGFQVEVASPADALAGIHVIPEARPVKDGVLRRVVTTTQGYSSGMVLASSMFALVGIPGLAPVRDLAGRRLDGPAGVQRRPRPPPGDPHARAQAPGQPLRRRDLVRRAQGLSRHDPPRSP